jgi:hypothetical protein
MGSPPRIRHTAGKVCQEDSRESNKTENSRRCSFEIWSPDIHPRSLQVSSNSTDESVSRTRMKRFKNPRSQFDLYGLSFGGLIACDRRGYENYLKSNKALFFFIPPTRPGFLEFAMPTKSQAKTCNVDCRVLPRHPVGKAVSDRVVSRLYYWKYLC